ncbi:MAG: glycosyltransferase [Bacteroidaceae bacterium]|nr:glycosyltransferase [Bacteroidaceae bacterium]
MKKKVLFMIDSLTCGGAEKSLVSLLPLLDYSKVEVDLMMVNMGGVFEQFVPKEVHIIPFPNQGGVLFKICQLFFSVMLRLYPQRHGAELRWKAMGTAYKRVEKKYDVAIAYQQGFPTYYVAEKVMAKKKIAWVNADITNVGYKASFNRPFYDQMDYVCPVSDKLHAILAASDFVDSKKLHTVLDILNVNLIREMAKQPLPTNSTQPLTICTVGRMVALKGYDLAVEAACLLKERGLKFNWFFVGDGGERTAVEELIKKYHLGNEITLCGMHPNPYPYMAAADIYVQTSRFEGFGLTIAEAKILGRPVVSTNFDVVHDQLKHEENGLIAEMTPESITDNILRLVNDDELREKIIANVKKEENTTYLTEIGKVERMIG